MIVQSARCAHNMSCGGSRFEHPQGPPWTFEHPQGQPQDELRVGCLHTRHPYVGELARRSNTRRDPKGELRAK